MNGDDLDVLIHRYFEKTLTIGEEERLIERLRADPGAADLFVELAELESGLVESLRAEVDLPSGVHATVRASRRRLRLTRPGRPAWPYVAAAGVFILALALYVFVGGRTETRETARRPLPPVPPAPEDRRAEWEAEQKRAESRLREIDQERKRLEGARAKAAEERKPEVQREVETRLAQIEVQKNEETTRLEKVKEELAAEKVTRIAQPERVGATLERVEGEVLGAGVRLEAGRKVLSGEGLDVRGAKALAILRLDDGTRVELRGDSMLDRLRIEGGQKVFTLGRGTVVATVVKQPARQSVLFITPQAEVTVIGTRLVVAVSAEATRVDVEEGRVRCKRLPDGASVEVGANHFAVAAKGAPLAAKPIVLLRSFQDGVSPAPDYAGTRDTSISQASPASNAGSLDQLRLYRSSETENTILLRWDVSSIPPGSRILSAEVGFWITGALGGPSRRLYDLRRSWEESEATWRIAGGGRGWQVAGAQGEGDRGRVALADLAPASNGFSSFALNESGVALVQSWVNAPARNFGVAIATPNASAWDLDSREGVTPERRPRLTVSFIPGAGK